MPQMFPLLWVSLFMLTSFMLMIMMTFIFYSCKPTPVKSNQNMYKMLPNWKW